MMREILPDTGGNLTGGERSLSMYRMWHCFDCGLEFSMKTRQLPKLCPRCLLKFDELPPGDHIND